MYIVNRARSHGVVRVTELVAELGVSSMTVRRDLDVLAGRGVLEKFHGGAALRRADGSDTAQHADPEDGRDTHIGIVVPADEYYFASILGGIRYALEEQAVRRSLVRPPRDPRAERKLIEELAASGSAGLVLAPSIDPEHPDPGYIELLMSLAVPVVLVEREVRDERTGRSLSAVRTDHGHGCRIAVDHLRQLGHRGVALVTHGGMQSGTRVINGWRDAVRRAKLVDRYSPLVIVDASTGWSTDASMDRALDRLREARVTALICHSDQLALPLAHRAKVRGWNVPGDLSVISYDDESAEMADPPLTAVSPPKTWLGRTAVRTLLELISEGAEAPVRRILAEPRLVPRGSTAVPRTAALA